MFYFKMSPFITSTTQISTFLKISTNLCPNANVLILGSEACIFFQHWVAWPIQAKLVQRRKRSKVNAAPPRCFFPTRPSDEYDSAPSRKILAYTYGRFRLYRLRSFKVEKWVKFLPPTKLEKSRTSKGYIFVPQLALFWTFCCAIENLSRIWAHPGSLGTQILNGTKKLQKMPDALPAIGTSPNRHSPQLAVPSTGPRLRLKSSNCRYTMLILQ